MTASRIMRQLLSAANVYVSLWLRLIRRPDGQGADLRLNPSELLNLPCNREVAEV